MTMLDGRGLTTGTEPCQCKKTCPFPCWQRVGIAPLCGACGCLQQAEYEAAPVHSNAQARRQAYLRKESGS